ncbi:helix-turn-helix transcriptional regulator [Burkholderiaceae bacterium UC74_6]
MKTTSAYEPARSRLARNLVRFRARLGMNQDELAYKAGLHRSYVGHLEQKRRNPSLENVEKLALALEVDIRELFSADAV